jgi:hypothetical protein
MTKVEPPSDNGLQRLRAGPGRRPEPLGAYRRAIRLEAGDGWSTAEMEDDVHHFRARLVHDGVRILAVEGEGPRTPWSNCLGAVGQLRTLEGMTLQAALSLPGRERAQHCTHLFDLAVLAAAHAGEPGFRRAYRIQVHHRPDGRARAELTRDGEPALAWEVENGVIEGSPFDGVAITALSQHLSGLSPEAMETALVLRRASQISYVRHIDLDAFASSLEIPKSRQPVCYAQQPHRLPDAKRNRGTARDFWGQGAWPLADDPAA